MDKEDYFELLENFVRHLKEIDNESFENTIQDMCKGGMFILNGEELKDQFEEMI